VDQAENGLQGFNLMKAGPYDLVLLDFLMPIMDGIDVAKKLRTWEHILVGCEGME
jgi:CheY-like chemotaxis protein